MTTTYIALDVMIHILILFTFLSLFFFMYVSKIETGAFQNEIGDNLEKSVTDILDRNRNKVLPTLNRIRPGLNQLQNTYSMPMKYSTEKNRLLRFTSIFIALLLLCAILSIVITLKFDCGKDSGIWHIIIENVIVFIFIGIVEYWFFTNIAIKYIPTSPSLMVDTMIDTVKQELNPQ